jgi:fatty-acid peroxygenase
MTHTATRDTSIPRLRTIDSTAAFLRDGYTFGQRQFDSLRTNAFRTRLLGVPVVVVRGADAASMFAESDQVGNDRAVPASLPALLRGGGARLPSGDAGRRRQELRERMLTDAEALGRLREFFAEEWRRAIDATSNALTLADDLRGVLNRAGIRWIGSAADEADAAPLADDRAAAAWAADMIRDVRSERRVVARASVLRQVADYLEDGQPLSERDAAAELLAVMRSVTDASRLVAFVALALHRNREWADRFAAGVGSGSEVQLNADTAHFVDEVRRFYPLWPVTGGRVLRGFTWHGRVLRTGTRILLDGYATNHDHAVWEEPYRFRPERFEVPVGDTGSVLSQSGGRKPVGSGFADEHATTELMKEAVGLLTRETEYSVPDQDLRVSLKRFPSVPESGFVMDGPERRSAG